MVVALRNPAAELPRPGVNLAVRPSRASAQKPIGLDSSLLGIEDDGTAFTTAVSALDIYSLCQPARDATVSCTELETVLQERFGIFPGSPDGTWFPELLGTGSSRKRVDFLSFWLGLGNHLAEEVSLVGRSEPSCLLSTIRGMECFGQAVLKLCRKKPRNAMLRSQDLICLLRVVRESAQDPAYWDEVIAAVPDDQGLMLSLPEVAEAVHVWLKDCVRAEVDGSEVDSPYVSPLIGSTRTSIVSVTHHASPTTAQAFSAWVGAASSVNDQSSEGMTSAESQSTSNEDVESHLALTEAEDVELLYGLADSATEAESLSAGQDDVCESVETCPELAKVDKATEILLSHISTTKSSILQESMRCLSTSHKALQKTLSERESQIMELHGNLEKMNKFHAHEIDKLQVENSVLSSQLAERGHTKDNKEGKCVLCLDGYTSHASVPCGHLAFCGACAAERPSPVCPVCRQPSQCVIRIFKP